MKKKLIEFLKWWLIFIGIWLSIIYVWQMLEIILYGEIQHRIIDDVVGYLFVVSVFVNVVILYKGFKQSKTQSNGFLSCKEYAETQKNILAMQISEFQTTPTLCVVQIGNDPASNSYVRGKEKDCKEVGINFKHIKLDNYEDISEYNLISLIDELNNSETIDGIIIQLPIPDKYNVKELQKHISPIKDVDGFRKDSIHRPCTPAGIIDYLKYNNISLSGKVCTVIGRSEIVGKPLVNLLIDEGATVISCNSKTPDVKKFTKKSDIVISAIGKANFFDASYFNPNQILIDVGINRDENGRLCGDIQSNAKEKVIMSTPVPGGVGLLTRVTLLRNTVNAYLLKNEKEE